MQSITMLYTFHIMCHVIDSTIDCLLKYFAHETIANENYCYAFSINISYYHKIKCSLHVLNLIFIVDKSVYVFFVYDNVILSSPQFHP